MNAERDGSESRAKTCAECGWWHTGECCDHHPELSDDQGTCHHPAHAAPESAPAGLPLHEATDRDGDNVPSDDGQLMIRVPYADLEALVERAEKAEAAIARVELLLALGPLIPADDIRAALRGPEPTEEP